MFKKLLLSATALFSINVLANKESINQNDLQTCSGMYSKSTWGGAVNPYITTNLLSSSDDDSLDISVIVFDYQDIDVLGHLLSDGYKKYVCDQSAISQGLCDEDDLGKFIINKDKLGQNKSEIITYTINSKGLQSENEYAVKNTGYYCVAAYESSIDTSFKIEVNFRNSFGQIAAASYPKIPSYAALALLYAITFAYYGFNFWKHKHEVLPLQKYFLFFFTFLTLESVLVWSLYDLTNVKGSADAGVKVYVVFISILNGFKFSFSFFLLLIISLGYGIVYPKLEKKLMLKVRIFSLIHLGTAVFYIIVNYLTTSETVGLAGFAIIPVMVLTIVFYVVILKTLSQTTALLNTQKQIVKLKIYRHSFTVIFVSLLILILGVFVASFIYLGMSTTELIEQHWKTRFLFLEFWPSLAYFAVFNIVAFIWRPTDTSYMLAASSQLPTDPENAADFELDDIQSLQEPNENGYSGVGEDNDSLNLGSEDEDDEDDEENHRGKDRRT